ncbi:aminotransferase class V-fold PLP-dependent enzyme [Alicyclobacillus shizuokensis]|uniref:aminotransferase class V-fold PLP-dependent enzyme n=1 Tax=Alicyclobacillus shizuokensis TaxID=392014 RepID=UPI00082DD4F8|nr:aminotransferase class V-fold PLP-dependent enzyme [Alicyclobacillus shizuokensis]
MEFYPLQPISLDEAKQVQFRLVEAIADVFTGTEFFQMGDVGVPPSGRPLQTQKVEQVIAKAFGVPDCALVRGAGTGAIRLSLSALLDPGDPVIIHTAPIYPTTEETFRALGLKPLAVDFHDDEALVAVLPQGKVLYIQHTRQQPSDHYDLAHVIQTAKRARPNLPIVVDENYAVFKTRQIGVEVGADISTFSAFKLLGPEGIGVVLGDKDTVARIRTRNYSGGGQVQGPEAMEVLRALTMAPVLIAVQSEQVDALARMLNDGAVPGISEAYIANAQSRTVIARLEQPIAAEVIKTCNEFGAAPYPVGAESKYEVLPMIYRASGTVSASLPELKSYLLRINPMRASADLVVKILKQALAKVQSSHD